MHPNAYRVSLLLGSLLALLSSGCGGSKGGSTPSSKLSLAINWPARGRLIPDAANSIKLQVFVGPDEVASKVVARPEGGEGTTTIVIENLPPVTVTLKASAHPNADGTGTAQAMGTTLLTLTASSITSTSILMGSTIHHIGLSPSISSVRFNESKTVTATAFDQANNMILTSPANWTWQVSNGNLQVAPEGSSCTVTGASAGSANLTIRETESGVQLVTALTITSGTGSNGYTIIPIGQLGGESIAYGINDQGDVVGSYRVSGVQRPFVYRNGIASQLPIQDFPSFGNGEATGINNDGKIVGYGTDGVVKACVWYSDGSHRYVRDAGQSRASGVGVQGQIIGTYRANSLEQWAPADWPDDDADANVHAPEGSSIAINESGVIAYAYFRGVFEGRLQNGSTWETLQGSGSSDQMLVRARSGNKTVGTLGKSIAIWTGTSLQIIGSGNGEGINADGVVVGATMVDSAGFVYTPSTGIEDLLSKVSNNSGWIVIRPKAINANGQIVGVGIYNNQQHAFLLNPN